MTTYTEDLKHIESLISGLTQTELIVNNAIGAIIVDFYNFKRANNINELTIVGKSYYIGTFNDKAIYVDPNLKWSDTLVLDKNSISILLDFNKLNIDIHRLI